MVKNNLHNWTSNDLIAFTARIDRVKEELGCSALDLIELLDVLDTIQNLIPNCSQREHRYFLETIDNLVALAKERLDKFREGVIAMEGQQWQDNST